MNAPTTLAIGQKFARLTVRELTINPAGKRAWRCLCDCGNEVVRTALVLQRGIAKSCGCYNASSDRAVKHGHARRGKRSHLHSVWSSMWQRCSWPKSQSYKHYGGRGISVCAEWEDFGRFLSDMGPRPKGGTLERIDNDGNYEPGNCRWATRTEQARNMRKVVRITHNGVSRPLREWAEILSLSPKTIYSRLRRGLPPLVQGKAERTA